MGKVREWSEDEDLRLTELYKRNTAFEVSEIMGMTVAQIRTRIRILHLKKKPRYPEQHLDYLHNRETQRRYYWQHREEKIAYFREYRRREKEKQLK